MIVIRNFPHPSGCPCSEGIRCDDLAGQNIERAERINLDGVQFVVVEHDYGVVAAQVDYARGHGVRRGRECPGDSRFPIQ